jgi:hypothetical protein
MTEHFCTLFNQNYLLRALALYRSLKRYQRNSFVLWALCFDDIAYNALVTLNEPDLRPISLTEFEDEALLEVKPTRSTVEYFFTCSPSLPLYLLKRERMKRITYVDADMLFFADTAPVFKAMSGYSILIIPHRFPSHLEHLKMYGVYNVGLLVFRDDAAGRACLTWWRERCLEWCYDRLEDGKFADQKYLDDWITRFPYVLSLAHPGVNLAPWNWMNSHITKRDGQVYVDDQPLIVYHYQGLKLLNRWLYDPGYELYGDMSGAVRQILYPPYIRALYSAWTWARASVPDIPIGLSGLTSRTYWRALFAQRLLKGQISMMRPPFL